MDNTAPAATTAPVAPAPAPAPAPTGNGAVIARMQGFSDMICKCADKACIEKVSDEMTRWGQEQAKSQQETQKMTEDDVKQITAVTEAMTRCMTRVLSAGTDAPAQ